MGSGPSCGLSFTQRYISEFRLCGPQPSLCNRILVIASSPSQSEIHRQYNLLTHILFFPCSSVGCPQCTLTRHERKVAQRGGSKWVARIFWGWKLVPCKGGSPEGKERVRVTLAAGRGDVYLG